MHISTLHILSFNIFIISASAIYSKVPKRVGEIGGDKRMAQSMHFRLIKGILQILQSVAQR